MPVCAWVFTSSRSAASTTAFFVRPGATQCLLHQFIVDFDIRPHDV
jgi:hypothetical protein